MPVSLYAYSWYSRASVGSDGTVYGWGVTDATFYPMYHIAYVSARLGGWRIRPDALKL